MAKTHQFFERTGLNPALIPGYLGLLLFMIGDGVEAGFLSPYLSSLQFTPRQVALVFGAYGLTASFAAWSTGALSDLLGPRRVMWLGLIIWVSFEIAFLFVGLRQGSFLMVVLTYGLRGFGYPLFAFGFLVWIAAATPSRYLGTAMGYFWFAFASGLPTLGSLFASLAIPRIGQYNTFCSSLGLVIAGGLFALLLMREPHGARPIVSTPGSPFRVMSRSITIAWQNPKIAVGGICRAIDTSSEFGFLVFMPAFFMKSVGFSLEQWLRLLSVMFASNVVWNLLHGIIGDKFGWRKTVTYAGGVGCCVTTLLLYYVPHFFGSNFPLILVVGALYGCTLAGYVPLSALMPSLAPESPAAALSILNLGAGISAWLGPAVVGIFLPIAGVQGVIWVFAILYILSAVLSNTLRLKHGTLNYVAIDAEREQGRFRQIDESAAVPTVELTVPYTRDE